MFLCVVDDIDVPEEEEDNMAPPHYEEVIEQDMKKVIGTKLTKPLKSIMKNKGKVQRRESDVNKRDSSDGHSPRHSMVQSSSMSPSSSVTAVPTSAAFNARHSMVQSTSASVMSSSASASVIPQSASANGIEIADPNMINVTVLRNSSRTIVDQLELRGLNSVTDIQHRRSGSYPEGNFESPPLEDNAGMKPVIVPAGHLRDFHSAFNGGGSSTSSNASLNTAL